MRYIYPPHPDSRMKIMPTSVGRLEEDPVYKGKYLSQRKFNGSQAVIWVHNGEVDMMNRHGEGFTTYRLTEAMKQCFLSLAIPDNVECVLNGELLHTKAVVRSKGEQAAKDTIVLYDLLFYRKHLLTPGYLDRYDMLRQICRSPESLEPKKRALEVVTHEGSNLWLAQNFMHDFSDRFYDFYEFENDDYDNPDADKYPEIEGLVCKRIGASKLKLGNAKYDVDWMIRVRKTKEKIYLF